MECGEIDFSMLLDEQRGKPLNFNFVGLYWQQVGHFRKSGLTR
jgi:serine/threonine-protein kinase TTK/MPS1